MRPSDSPAGLSPEPKRRLRLTVSHVSFYEGHPSQPNDPTRYRAYGRYEHDC